MLKIEMKYEKWRMLEVKRIKLNKHKGECWKWCEVEWKGTEKGDEVNLDKKKKT